MIFWRIVTIAFAAVPATVYSAMAFLAAAQGLATAVTGVLALDPATMGIGILFFLWGSFGLFGTWALWWVGLGFVTRRAMRGLIAGVIAILPFLYIMNPSTTDLWGMLVVALPLIACVWIVLLSDQRRNDETLEQSPPHSDAEEVS